MGKNADESIFKDITGEFVEIDGHMIAYLMEVGDKFIKVETGFGPTYLNIDNIRCIEPLKLIPGDEIAVRDGEELVFCKVENGYLAGECNIIKGIKIDTGEAIEISSGDFVRITRI